MSDNTPRGRLVIIVLASAFAAATTAILFVGMRRRKKESQHNQTSCNQRQQKLLLLRVDPSNTITTAYEQLIEGGTPMIYLRQISKHIQRNVYCKMESFNPGGTGKDRAALSMIRTAEKEGWLPSPHSLIQTKKHGTQFTVRKEPFVTTRRDNDPPLVQEIINKIHLAMEHSTTGGLVVEGTSGSTGIALATLCASRGHACLVVMPDDQAMEKQRILGALGAVVHVVPNAAISNPHHYVNVANKAATVARDRFGIAAVFMNQFENEANFEIHYRQTGPELFRQCPQLDAFVMSSGTGGTIAGVSKYLKQVRPTCRVVLVDPPGSALYHRIEHGVAYATQQAERTLRRHRYDTLAEGIGLDRLTYNFSLGLDCIDRAIRVSDQEAVDMAHFLLEQEGLWVGSSSAMNVVGALRTALSLPPDSTVVTVICDGGQRHATRFWNPMFIRDEWGLIWPPDERNKNGTRRIPECLKEFVLNA